MKLTLTGAELAQAAERADWIYFKADVKCGGGSEQKSLDEPWRIHLDLFPPEERHLGKKSAIDSSNCYKVWTKQEVKLDLREYDSMKEIQKIEAYIQGFEAHPDEVLPKNQFGVSFRNMELYLENPRVKHEMNTEL